MFTRTSFKLVVLIAVAVLAACGGKKEEAKMAGLDIQVKDIPAMKITYVEVMGPYDQIGNAFMTFGQWVSQNVPPTVSNGIIGIYYDDPNVTPAESLRADVAAIVPPDFAATEGHPVKELPAMKVASVTLTGSYEKIAQRYGEIYGWIAQHNYSVAGPLFEVYLKYGPDMPDSTYVTEVRVPIEEYVAD